MRAWPFLTGAALAALALVGVYVVFVRDFTGQIVDERAKLGAHQIAPSISNNADRILDPLPLLCLTAGVLIVIAVGLARRRGDLILLGLGVIAGSNATTQLLKHVVLTRPEIGATWEFSNSLPSGHTTVVASVAFAAFLVSAPRARPAVAFAGAVGIVITGFLLLLGQWHRPSDVMAGILVVAVWGCLAGAVAALRRPRIAPRSRHNGTALAWTALALGTASVAAVVPVVATVDEPGAHLPLACFAGLAAISAVGAGYAAAVTRLFRRLG